MFMQMDLLFLLASGWWLSDSVAQIQTLRGHIQQFQELTEQVQTLTSQQSSQSDVIENLTQTLHELRGQVQELSSKQRSQSDVIANQSQEIQELRAHLNHQCDVNDSQTVNIEKTDVSFNHTEENDVSFNHTEQNDVSFNHTEENDVSFNHTEQVHVLHFNEQQRRQAYKGISGRRLHEIKYLTLYCTLFDELL